MNTYYSFNRNLDYKKQIDKIIQSRKEEILSFFKRDKDSNFDIKIYVYDTIEDLKIGMKKRGFGDMPNYMCGCYKEEDNSINLFEPKDHPNDNEWSKEEYEKVIFHEMIHAIQFMIYGNQPEWLTEGIAKYLDGSYQKGIKSLLENHIHKNYIPSMDELEFEFGKHEYNSYDYAYLMISYLIEKYGKEQFLEFMKDKEQVSKMSEKLVVKAICYYNKKYFDNEFYNEDLRNPNWLFHGSPLLLTEVEMKKSQDSLGNKDNMDTAIFVTSSEEIASAYAFKDSIKEKSRDLDWDFEVNSQQDFPIMKMRNVNIDENLSGYIYVFVNDGSFKNSPVDSLQFKSYQPLLPDFYKKIYYKDYQYLYEVNYVKTK